MQLIARLIAIVFIIVALVFIITELSLTNKTAITITQQFIIFKTMTIHIYHTAHHSSRKVGKVAKWPHSTCLQHKEMHCDYVISAKKMPKNCSRNYRRWHSHCEITCTKPSSDGHTLKKHTTTKKGIVISYNKISRLIALRKCNQETNFYLHLLLKRHISRWLWIWVQRIDRNLLFNFFTCFHRQFLKMYQTHHEWQVIPNKLTGTQILV